MSNFDEEKKRGDGAREGGSTVTSNTSSYSQFDLETYVSFDTVTYELDGLRLDLPTNYISKIDKNTKKPIVERSAIHSVRGVGGSKAKVQGVHLVSAGRYLTRVTGSLPKLFSGQNMWSPALLEPLLFEVHARILSHIREFAVQPLACNLGTYGPRSIKLTCVHLAVCFGFARENQPRRLIAHMYQSLGSDPKIALRKYGDGYLKIGGQARRGRHIAFYDKVREVRDKYGAEALKELNLPRAVLKIELRLERDELEKRGLERLNAWRSPETAAKVFKAYVGPIVARTSLSVPTLPLPRRELRKLPPQLRLVAALKAAGIEWETLVDGSTRHRYRRRLADLGISAGSAAKPQTVPVRKILSRDRAITGADLPQSYVRRFRFSALARYLERQRKRRDA